MSGVVLVGGAGAWACVPGHDHSAGGNTGGSQNTGASATPVPAGPAAPGPEAASPSNATATQVAPAVPASPAASSGAGRPSPATAAASGESGTQKVLGIGLFAAGAMLVLGGIRQAMRSQRPRARLATAGS